MSPRRTVILIVAIALAAVAAFSTYTWLNGVQDRAYAKAKRVQVFVVKKYNVERVNKRPIEFRDKTLCDIAQADLTEISVTAGDKGDKSYTVSNSGGSAR